MEKETKNCQNCKKDFVIDAEDFAFYEKIKVPPPTWCPHCRFQRRLSFLNWTSLYKRKCDSCEKDMISVHHENKPFKVFCNPCWWKDNWDGTEYSMDYDPSRPFLEQVIELRNKSNFMGLETLYSSLVNTPYTNAAAYQKDCFMVFNADYGERCAYSMTYAHLNECLDTYRMKNCELCYECIGSYKSYRCFYSEELESCSDVYFSRACNGCTNCFGCINLRNKSYYIFNKEYSKEEYKEKLKEFKVDTIEGVENMRKMAQEFWLTQPQRSFLGNSLNVNVTGEIIYESKNAKDCYIVSNVEDSRYVQLISLAPVKDCYDYTVWGNGAEKIYECLTIGEGGYNDKFCMSCWPQAVDSEYCMYTIQPKNCFGCVNLKRKEYCILNKQYTKEEYEKLKSQIIEDMHKNPYIDKNGRSYKYGEFLPFELSAFDYNETAAKDFFPLEKEKSIAMGAGWYEAVDNMPPITLKLPNLPKSSEEISENILKEILECNNCHKAYRISELELYLLKKMGMPLPILCWKCRDKRRMSRVNKPGLYDRNCDKCGKDIKTPYAPERPETIYCETCYQQETV